MMDMIFDGRQMCFGFLTQKLNDSLEKILDSWHSSNTVVLDFLSELCKKIFSYFFVFEYI